MSDRQQHIAVLVGSLREGSYNRQLAELAVAHAPEGVTLSIVDGLDNLPFYNEDIDTPEAEPVEAKLVRDQVAAADAVLLVTPEYNGTLPALLKNAIDWLSRPYGAGAIKDKSAGVIGAALGQYAGTWSRQDTRKSLTVAGAVVVEDIEIGIVTGTLGDAGVATDETVAAVVEAVRVLAGRVEAAV